MTSTPEDAEGSLRNSIEDEAPEEFEFEFSTVRAERLKMFSDAVWSIIATIMIAPSMHFATEGIHKEKLAVATVASRVIPQIGFYFLAFLIVCSTWATHVWTFQTMEEVTDLSIIMNLAVLLAGSLLPYFYSLMTQFMTWKTVLIYASVHVIISLLLTGLIRHAFRYDEGHILRRRIRALALDDREEKKSKILTRIWIAPAFAVVAVPLSLASNVAATVCLSFILLFPWVQSFVVWLETKIHEIIKPGKYRVRRRMLERDVILTERIRKSRIEAFNDGAFAIVSTLLVLDITEKYLPTKAQMKNKFDGDAIKSLSTYCGVYLSYMLTFILIGLLWDAQLTLFKNMKKISRLMLLVNQWSVACVGVIPLAFTFILQYTVPGATRAGIRIGCIGVFLTGFWNFTMYLITLGFANWKSDELWLHPRVMPGGDDFVGLILELSASPVCSAVVFSLTFLEDELVSAWVGGTLVILYALFLIFWKTLNSTFCNRRKYESLPGTTRSSNQ